MYALLAQIRNPILREYGEQQGETFFGSLFGATLGVIFVFGVVAFIFMLFFGGVKMMTSSGDKVAAQSSRSILTNAIIGLVILALFYGILNFFECFFGFGFKQFSIGPFEISPISSAVCVGGSSSDSSSPPPPPPPPGTVNAACSYCISGPNNCGITNEVYVGPCGSTGFCRCTSGGWVEDPGPRTSTSCPACP